MMRFKVARTSMMFPTRNEPPCEEAAWEAYVFVDIRNADDPAKIPWWAKLGTEAARAQWQSEGRNHRIIGGHIARDFDRQGWFVHIDSLDELMAFARKYGQLVISPASYLAGGESELEIYDSYRE